MYAQVCELNLWLFSQLVRYNELCASEWDICAIYPQCECCFNEMQFLLFHHVCTFILSACWMCYLMCELFKWKSGSDDDDNNNWGFLGG